MTTVPASPQSWKILPLQQNADRHCVHLGKLPVHSRSAIRFIDYTDIIYCRADSNYTELHLTSGEKVVTSQCLKSTESQIISEHFTRIHARYLVNLTKMTGLVKDTNWRMVLGEVELPIARTRLKTLKDLLNL